MKKYCYLDAGGEFKGPFTANELQKLKEMGVVGEPTQVLDETTRRMTSVGVLFAAGSGPVVFPVTPATVAPPPLPVPPVIGAARQVPEPPQLDKGLKRPDTCKICGAPRDPLNISCKFCATAYALERVTGESYISALQTILRTIEQEAASQRATQTLKDEFTGKGHATGPMGVAQRQVSAISTFAMPADVENLLQFLAFCHGNAQMTVGFNDIAGDRLKGAWYGKAKMAFTQLKMKAVANPTLAPYIAEYEPVYGVGAKKPLSGQTKLIMGLVAFFIGILVFAGIMASGESKQESAEKNRLAGVIQNVQSQIAAGQYDAAEASCANIQMDLGASI